jgi:Zn ribbon nucleic-acid-binding protein
MSKACVPCPECGEADIDNLVHVDTETVECQSCGFRYEPRDFIIRRLNEAPDGDNLEADGSNPDEKEYFEPDPGDMDGDFDTSMRDAGLGTDEDYGPSAAEIL